MLEEKDWRGAIGPFSSKKNNFDQLSIDAIQQGWGTIFTLAFSLTQEKKSFLQEFIKDNQTCMQDILAFILCANPALAEDQVEAIENAQSQTRILKDVLSFLKKMNLYESNQITQRIR